MSTLCDSFNVLSFEDAIDRADRLDEQVYDEVG